MKSVCLLICFVGLLGACRESVYLDTKKLKVAGVMESVADSVFFSDVWSLSCMGDKLFFIDQRTSKVFVMSDDFSGCRYWGESGHAGNEFVFLAGVYPWRDSVFVLDGGRRVVFIYGAEGNLLELYSLEEEEVFLAGGYRCVVGDRKLVGGAYTIENGCMSIDMSGHEVFKWGRVFDFESANQEILRNGRHLFLSDSVYLAVSDNLPIVEFYNQKYEFVAEYNYSDVDFVHTRLQEIKRQEGGENSYSILCYDAYLYNHSLYLLMTGKGERGYAVNRIMELKIDGSSVISSRCLLLPGEVYTSICVNAKGVFAYNKADSRLEFFH